ncbi:MAG: exonuclease [Desulfobacteraceae bacterium]|nr:MAG: exonuclease [Desulfobacteraceae bacterium]
MLERTFIHIQGIGLKTEQNLWKRGFRCWDDFIERREIVFSPERDAFIEEELRDSRANIGNIAFFKERLSAHEMWRLYSTFESEVVFLDIETNGGFDEITLIGLYDGQTARTFINGQNLQEFETAVADFKLVVTFNGSSFDLPIIRRSFPGITLPVAHIDLRFLLRKLGLKGGLKSIEEQLAIRREPEVRGLGGFDAIWLWQAYQAGDRNALERLIRYNTADIVNLKPLLLHGCAEMKKTLLTA